MIEKVVEMAKQQGGEILQSFKILLGVDEDLKAREEYKNSFHTDSFSSLLPYLGWHDSADLFILDGGDSLSKESKSTTKKGFLGFTLEANPQTGANDSMESILQSLYLQAPTGSSISIHLYASSDIMPPLKELSRKRYSDSTLGIKKESHEKRNTNIYQTMSRRTIDYYLHGIGKSLFPDGNNLLIRDFRLIVSVATPFNYKNEADVTEALLLRDQIKSTLNSAGFGTFAWKPNDLINFVSDFLDHSRVFHPASKLFKNYEPQEKIRKQMVSREQEYTVTKNNILLQNSMSKEETAIIQLSVAQYPRHFHLAETSSLVGDFFQSSLAYPCPFMITTSAVVQDYDSMRTRATLKTATSVRKTEGYMAKLDPQLGEEAMEWKHALSSIEDGGTLIKMATNITLITKKKDAAKAKSDVMAIWRSKGFRLADDRYQQLVSFLSSMPMALTSSMIEDLNKMHRFSTKFSQNAVSLSPCLAEWKGTKTPVMSFVGRRGQLTTLDFLTTKRGTLTLRLLARLVRVKHS
ncbi:DUF5934 domain-containing protein [Thiomicrorhabdus aquaedulcis]|uniref:TraC family protein n=1 Tax=Thiomicrorhabdus aquaedulcis TaxID=2211106 RepID=UPI000FD75CC0|nr:DUF5934 domain-containing protein [Thiomicrorhabdus aquaedulcis]